MPRQLVRASGHDRNRSLGWLAVEWLEYLTVHGRGDPRGEPVVLGDEYTGFTVDCYCLDAKGNRLYDSAFLSRPKGADKSGRGSGLSLFEGLGPCRFAGFAKGGEVYEDPWGLGFVHRYIKGEPMGRPVRAPFIRCLATEEGQSGNVYESIQFNLTDGPLSEVPGIDPGLTRSYLPGGGVILPSTASSAAKDGGLETFVDFDETHLYTAKELHQMYDTVTRNLVKRKKSAGTWFLETTTMFAPGEESVAEDSYHLAALIEEGQTAGKAKVKRERHFSDHRWGECEDLSDEKALRAAIAEAYGDAMAWMDIEGLVNQVLDPRANPTDSRRFILNAPTEASNAWLAEHEWTARRDLIKTVTKVEPITLGFDGSRKRSRGVTDATALIGCRVSDGHVFELGIWEQPSGEAGRGWEVPVAAVDATVRQTFKDFKVVGFYADPALWESKIAGWEAEYGRQLKVKSSGPHPIAFWMSGGSSSRANKAIDEFHSAIVDGEMTHDGSGPLTRHCLNARNKPSTYGMSIKKDNPDSFRKIDGAVAASLAWRARLDALAAGVGRQSTGAFRKVR